jgi:creatinine amidohydrolase
MRRLLLMIPFIAASASATFAQAPTVKKPAAARATKAAAVAQPLVEFEMMTWPEVKHALESGKTTALFYTGGTEQRGIQDVNGGHNLMARAIGVAIAQKLGNAIAMPVLPYTPNNASPVQTGTIGLTNDLLAGILERVSEQSILTGFKNVILMGEHGGGQPRVYTEVAKKLDDKYAEKGIHVYYCSETYLKSQPDVDAWLESQGYPPSSHAGIRETSTMLYLGADKGWVRKELIKDAVGDMEGKTNGVKGDARRSNATLGKKAFDTKVDYAVTCINSLVGKSVGTTAQK